VSFAGAVLVVRGCGELRTTRRATTTPQPRSCSQLLREGPGDNAHLMLNACRVCAGAALMEEGRGSRQTLWVPVAASDAECPEVAGEPGRSASPGQPGVRLLIRYADPPLGLDPASLGAGAAIHGLVLDRLTSLPRAVKARFYGSQFTVLGQVPDGWVLDHGRSPAGWGRVLGLLGGGVALIVAGLLGAGSGRPPSPERDEVSDGV